MSSKRDVHGSVRYQNDGRVVIVTGACSGIGWAIAAAFRESGAEVLAVFAIVALLTVGVGAANSRGIASRPPLEVLRAEV